jgi:hypothetical protein
MTRALAVKAYFEKDSVREKVNNTEFMAFWKSLSEEEKTEFGAGAGKELGVEITS